MRRMYWLSSQVLKMLEYIWCIDCMHRYLRQWRIFHVLTICVKDRIDSLNSVCKQWAHHCTRNFKLSIYLLFFLSFFLFCFFFCKSNYLVLNKKFSYGRKVYSFIYPGANEITLFTENGSFAEILPFWFDFC